MSREVVVRLASFNVFPLPLWIKVASGVILLNATSTFNHGNVSLPPAVDGVLRFIVVTPDMHRVHHSVIPRETNSNFGFNLPWWDRIGGTYRDQPSMGHDAMIIGLTRFLEAKRQTFLWMLLLPFKETAGE